MKRRAFVATVGSVLALGGCVDSSENDPDSQSESPAEETNTTSVDPSGTDDSDALALVDYSFSLVTDPAPEDEQLDRRDGGFGAPPAVTGYTTTADGTRITISGVVTARNGCQTGALLTPPAVDGATITAAVGTELKDSVAERRDAGEPVGCTQAIVVDRYELTIEYRGSPDGVAVTHSDMSTSAKTFDLQPADAGNQK